MAGCLASVPLTSDMDIARVLRDARTIAVLGASHKPARPSYQVMDYLLTQHCTVYPVNPGLAGQTVLGKTVYGSLRDIPEAIDMVDVFRQSQYLPEIVDDVVAVGASVLWTQLGVIDANAAAKAEHHGVEVIMDRCPAIEGPRLAALGLLDLQSPAN